MAETFDELLDRDAAQQHTHQCEDCTRALSRRSLLGGLLAGGVAMMTSGGLSMQAAFADSAYTGDTIIVLSLRGGIDGLSALAPLGDPNYAPARPTTAISVSSAIPVDAMFGLHPSLAPLYPMWAANQVAAVHAVGSMDQTRSHFQAMEQIENAAPGSSIRTGWLDRIMSTRAAGTPFQATTVGQSTEPLMADGPFPQMVVQSLARTRLRGAKTTADLKGWMSLTGVMHENTDSPLTASVHGALAASMTALGLVTAPAPSVTYPTSPLGGALSDIATMIKSGIGLQVATVDQGDWDHHTDARRRMTAGLDNLAACLAAFAKDLGPAWKRVTVVTISEFGRRVRENGDAGFDHGHGNVMFLASGSGLTGAKVFGKWPTLAPSKLSNGEDLAGTTDYRSVLTEVFTKRAGMSAAAARTAFPGFTATPVGAFHA